MFLFGETFTLLRYLLYFDYFQFVEKGRNITWNLSNVSSVRCSKKNAGSREAGGISVCLTAVSEALSGSQPPLRTGPTRSTLKTLIPALHQYSYLIFSGRGPGKDIS